MNTIDNNLDTGLVREGMSVVSFSRVATLAGITGASPARLFQSFRGEKPLSNETAILLWQLWRSIEGLCQRAKPFKLDLSDPETVHAWLVAAREGTLRLVVERGAEEMDLEKDQTA
jgi:hypothetical protein